MMYHASSGRVGSGDPREEKTILDAIAGRSLTQADLVVWGVNALRDNILSSWLTNGGPLTPEEV